jgi:cobalamin biosynthesis Mg chelatase CobN
VNAQEMCVQAVYQRLDGTFRRQSAAELLGDRLQEFQRRELWAQDQRDLGFLGKLLQQTADQGGLTCSHLARQLYEPAALRYAVDEVRERVRVARAHIQVTRIRSDRERLLV